MKNLLFISSLLLMLTSCQFQNSEEILMDSPKGSLVTTPLPGASALFSEIKPICDCGLYKGIDYGHSLNGVELTIDSEKWNQHNLLEITILNTKNEVIKHAKSAWKKIPLLAPALLDDEIYVIRVSEGGERIAGNYFFRTKSCNQTNCNSAEQSESGTY